ncbi:MAG: hypothetical protein RBS77_01110 [Candidatus Moranbacteria bacterium]|jgi:hypothetical protein|nr:hypothetical protein [Candidatus Moranbacteria bacterium]
MERIIRITNFLAHLIDELVGAFLEIEDKSSNKVVKKISLNFIGRFFYGVTDWMVAFGLGSFSFWMMFRRDIFLTEQSIFAGIFLWDFLWASIFFWISHKSKMDFTWGAAYKRVADVLWRYGFWGKTASVFYSIYFSIKAIAWEGPEVITCAYQKKLKSRENIWVSLYFLSTLQGFCGYWMYKVAYGLAEKHNVNFNNGVKVAAFGVLASIVLLGVFSLIGKMFRLLTVLLRNEDVHPIIRIMVFLNGLILLFGFIAFIAYNGLSR